MDQVASPLARQPADDGGDPAGGVRITAAAIQPPKGGGAISGLGQQLEHNPFEGSAKFDIPIPTPSPRGVSAGLALSYASASGNGPFGIGFDIAVAKFTRRSASFGIPRYDASDRFTHSEQGTLVERLTPAGQVDQRFEPAADPVWRVRGYLPRAEGSFARIEQWVRLADEVSHWIVQTNANETLVYGRSDEARIRDPRDPARIAEWLLEERLDAVGNKVRYRYSAADAAPGREQTSNRYLAEVAFGNFEHGGAERFNVRVVLDYGGHEGETPPPEPTAAPEPRPDPFSAYVTGFEVRTLWRCRRLLVYATHPGLFDCEPVLTRAVLLTYAQGRTGLSMLAAVQQRGWRRLADGAYAHEDLPPLTLGFTPFDPAAQSYAELVVEDGGLIPGPIGDGLYLPVDLDGEGLPGILFSSAGQTLYWPPLGDGRYGDPVAPERFPSFSDLGDPTLTLTSLDANGRLDLVSAAPGRAGYFALEPSGRAEPVTATTAWASFRPFEAIPAGLGAGDGELVSLNGDGRLDFLETQAPSLRCYPSRGVRGFGPADLALAPAGYPPSASGGARHVDAYADMFGDGLSHRVRISQGQVRCWPDLGYGVFGEPVSLANAPRFGDVFDAARLFLADLDGSGPNDLVYATRDSLLVFFNESGNGFGEPVEIPLPAPFDQLSQISFADVYGDGASCLVFTRLAPAVRHWVYAFAGRTKPYLLATLDDGMGGLTRCGYATSVQEYLRDKRAGRPWITQAYFPVQVVAEIERLDRIAAARTLQRFAYHDGYYDPALKQFQGFGEVESWDSETFEERQAAGRQADRTGLDPLAAELFAPIAHTRAWYHTGAYAEAAAIARRNREAYWSGDPLAPDLPGQWIAPQIEADGAATVRQAYAALAGNLIRREVYGLDGAPQQATPYSVSQAATGVRLVQRKGPNPNAVMQAFAREQLTADYEREAADPRVSHEFVLAQDDYGDVTRACQVAYPRRTGLAQVPYPYPEQQELIATARALDHVVHPGDAAEPYRWIGQPAQARVFELSGVEPAGRYFSFDEIDGQCDEALAHAIAYGQPFDPGERQARLFQWTRDYYWDAGQAAPLPLRGIGPLGLAHHGEAAVMTPALAEAAFGAAISAADIAAAGYAPDQGYWWNRGLIQHYETAAGGFSQPSRTDGRFDGVAEDSPLNPTTLVGYDAPALFVTSVSRVGTAVGPTGEAKPVTLTSTAVTDYQASLPASITDPNGVSTQFGYSPLGLVVATALIGSIDGEAAGDLPLDTRTPTPTPSLDAIVADPHAFLQGSTSYFHYDLTAWAAHAAPTAAIEVTRQLHVHQLQPGEQSPTPIAVTYRDGSGRDIEQRADAGPETAGGPDRWIVSGRVRLDNKGEPVQVYLPYYAASARYGDDTPLDGGLPPPDVLRYDALGRLRQELTSKGFVRAFAYGAWLNTAWDEDDTVLDSPFYKAFPTDPKTPDEKREAAALAQAARAFNTPTRTALDATGAETRVLAANLGAVTPQTLAPAVDGKPVTPQQLWDRLVADGYLAPAAQVPGAAWATGRLQPYIPRFQQAFAEQYGDLAAPTLAILKATGLTTRTELDIQGKVVRIADPRLFYGAVTGGPEAANFVFLLDMAGNPLRTESADAGTRLALADVFGNGVRSIDGRGRQSVTRYDRFLRPVQVDEAEPAAGETLTRRAEVLVYGELHPDPAARNLNGMVWQSFDDAGLDTTDLYDLAANALTPTRRIRTDYARPADWTAAAIAAVEQEAGLVTALGFDAEQARIFERTPDGSVTRFAYDLAGRIAGVAVQPAGEPQVRTIVAGARYSPFGARLRIAYGNGVVTESAYEATTQRLLRVTSANAAGQALQDVAYTYDPVGNVTDKLDRSWETVFCYNQAVDPASTYDHDPLYRLLRATGRQQAGASARGAPGVMPFCPPDPADQQQLETYAETFAYDDGGNMVRLRHQAAHGDWISELPVEALSNRLAGAPYDAAGNLLALDGAQLSWDVRGRLAAATLVARPGGDDDGERYLYDADGERMLRVTRRLKQAALGEAPAVFEVRETLFLGDYERTRIFQEGAGQKGAGAGETPLSVSEALTIPDDDGHFCVLERQAAQALTRRGAADGQWQARFLLSDQVASVTQETDGDGVRVTYREYAPYGATTFVAADSEAAAAGSRFRFAGKRCDDATGLYYFGARYYPPWLARWISPDPAGTVDGPNLYVFVEGNPTTFTDERGLGKVIKMHGKDVPKPKTHAEMHKEAEQLGEMIAKEIVSSGVDNTKRLKQLEKDIANVQLDSGLPIHKEDTVDRAMKAGMKGDKTSFDQLYRAALPGMDEQISTATMFYIAKGAGKVTMDKTQWKQFAYTFRIASRLRLETEFTGYQTSKGVVQHPTSKGFEFFASSGKGHTYWDRARREDAIALGLSSPSIGVDRMLVTIAEAGRHSLSYGIAPSRAKNVTTLGISKRLMRRQMRRREGIKRITLILQGHDIALYPTQSRHARWRPRRGAPPSPLRVGYY
ncbi:MAG TPA: SpvB/TcaC N-terminal domain-containing protein [Caulobacteraceae bacterium]|jgi:RHS repeat-associated protein